MLVMISTTVAEHGITDVQTDIHCTLKHSGYVQEITPSSS